MTTAAGNPLHKNVLHSFILALIIFILPIQAEGMPKYGCPSNHMLNWGGIGNLIFHLTQYNGQNILVLYGGIANGDDVRFSNYMRRLKSHGRRIDEIWLDSPGGDPSIAIKIGRTIRKYGIQTRIPSGYWCVSACNFIFLGGPFRLIDSGGQYVVHMFRREGLWSWNIEIQKKNTSSEAKHIIKRTEQLSALSAAGATAFVTSMGVSTKLLTDEMYHVDSEAIKCMSRSKLKKFNVMNFGDSGVGAVRRIK